MSLRGRGCGCSGMCGAKPCLRCGGGAGAEEEEEEEEEEDDDDEDEEEDEDEEVAVPEGKGGGACDGRRGGTGSGKGTAFHAPGRLGAGAGEAGSDSRGAIGGGDVDSPSSTCGARRKLSG